jgi:hypothetical protein
VLLQLLFSGRTRRLTGCRRELQKVARGVRVGRRRRGGHVADGRVGRGTRATLIKQISNDVNNEDNASG